MIQRGVLIFVEGYLERAFYEAVVQTILSRNTPPINEHLIIVFKVLDRIGNHQNSAIRIYKNQVLKDNSEVQFDVVLCYDSLNYKFSPKPPIDWRLVDHDLIGAGVQHVYHIAANKSIEDWILLDTCGVLTYLDLPQNTLLPQGDGINKIKSLYNKTNNVYVKGSESEVLVQYLDINKITSIIHKDLNPLIKLLK